MSDKLPKVRTEAIEKWPQPFLDLSKSMDLDVQIHGVGLKIRTTNGKLFSELQNFFPQAWQVSSVDPIEIFWRKPFEVEGIWDNIENPNCQFDESFISQRDFLAKKISSHSIELMAPETIDDGFFNFLRSLLPLELLKMNKVLFHSSCVVNEKGEAFLFFGPSGAGKTTISQLCQSVGGNVLGDDMNILCFDHHQVFVESATVGQRIFNKNNFAKKFPIKNAFWLQKAPLIRHREIESGQMSRLLSSFANFFWDQLSPVEYQKLFGLLSNINLNINLFELEFTKDSEVWNYVQSIR